jgi:hypothetical protein
MQWCNQAFWRPVPLRTEIMNFTKSQSFIESSFILTIIQNLVRAKKINFCSFKAIFSAHFGDPCTLSPGVAAPLYLPPSLAHHCPLDRWVAFENQN